LQSRSCLTLNASKSTLNMNFLHKTGGYFSQQCLSETSDFRFPREILKIFLQQTFQLLGKNLPKGVGNTSSTEKFQNGTHQQVGELEICLLEELPKARNSFQTQMLESTTLSMKKYLQRITSFLKDRQYSHCSWDAVQTELRSCFKFLHFKCFQIGTSDLFTEDIWCTLS
uniref:Interferon alpha n=1 Tax=Pavo cristatus TaxID=9049 RepID=A0A8C9F794_PAVCR